jgi:uncharacterized membrane protein
VDIPILLATWIHTVAVVIAWGFYGVLARIILPSLEQALDGDDLGATVAAIERRAILLVGLSGVLFVVTGSYLLVRDPEYAGLGNLFASPWTTLMLLKHVVVGGFIVLVVLVDRAARRMDRVTSEGERAQSMRAVKLEAEAATALGALIALLTVAAELAAP